jgi:hypothetical protein
VLARIAQVWVAENGRTIFIISDPAKQFSVGLDIHSVVKIPGGEDSAEPMFQVRTSRHSCHSCGVYVPGAHL